MRNVVVKITGGLGNQLFQYAAAQNICISQKANLVFEISHYDNQNPNESIRKFALDSFGLNYKIIITKKEHNIFYKFTRFENYLYFFMKKIFYEKINQYNPEYEKLKAPIHLIGHFQSIKYFNKHKTEIRNSLNLREIQKMLKVKHYENLIYSVANTVSVHFRRTDFVKDKFGEVAGCELPLTYYYESIKILGQILKEFSLIIFSDDIQWVKANFKFEVPIYYVEEEFDAVNDNGVADLYLMSKCNNHIIANSTFSWWGAFLNSNLEKIVVSPKWWVLEKYWTPNYEPVILTNI